MQPYEPQELPIADIEWEPLIPLIGKANRALAKYDGVLSAIPNPAVLLSPLTTQEAVLSSRIEGTQATLGQVYLFEVDEETEGSSLREDIFEILNYRNAIAQAKEELEHKPFNLNLLKTLHSTLMDSVRGSNKARGKFRTTQNWIGSPGTPIERASFIPPSPEKLLEYLSVWEKYYHSDRPDELVQLAVLHGQFEIIHPFLDGNGRLGRMLIPLFLFEKNILTQPTFYLSMWLETHRQEYYDRLKQLSIDRKSWNSWIEFFLKGLIEQAQANIDISNDILTLYRKMKERILHITHSQYAIPLLDQIFKKPIFEGRQLEFGAHSPTRTVVSKLLKQVAGENVINVLRKGTGSRGTVYVFADLINLCEGKKVF